MKIEFDSIGDLQEFLHFAGYEKRERSTGMPSVMAAPYGGSPVPDADLTPEERACAQAALDAEALGDLLAKLDCAGAVVSQGAPSEASQQSTETPKRKRRTKAEMEAERQAAAGGAPSADAGTGAASTQPSDAQAGAATSPLAGANPFDASTSNTPHAADALNEAPAGTTGTLAALNGAGSATLEGARAAVQGLGADVDPQAFIQLRVAEMGGEFDAREHMKKCVEFIGALGKARYDEAFDLAGTSRSVATYSPADCAKHIAALEYLQLSGS